MLIKQRKEIIKQHLLRLTITPQELMGFLVLSEQQLREYASGKPFFEDDRYIDFIEFIGIDKYSIGYTEPKREAPLGSPLTLFFPQKGIKNQPFKALRHVFVNLFTRTNKAYRQEITPKHLFEKNFGYTEPFMYKQVLLGLLLIFALSYFLADLTVLQNITLGLSIPLTLLILVYEFDKHDQLNLKDVLILFVVGGIVSMGITYWIRLFTGYPDGLLGDIMTGLVEETAKLIAAILFIRKIKFRNVYTAFVLAFAVGAGFDAFETMEYGLNAILSSGDYFQGTITLAFRSVLSFGIGHHYWTAIIFATLIGLSKSYKIDYHKLYHPTFILVYLFIVMFHAMFNYSNIFVQISMAVFGLIVFPYVGYQLYLKRYTEPVVEPKIFDMNTPVYLPN
jgi:RsiW-degrading membrane proteinase PrsW (M82 family)